MPPDRVDAGSPMQATIRHENPEDAAAIRCLNEQAFGQLQETRLIDLLRANGAVLLSLVAAVGDRVAGHILYSPVHVGSGPRQLRGAALGPMAVLPEFQRRGLGSKLIAEGTKRLRESACPFIVVLGHPEYYSRFGFVIASRHGLRCQWEVPDEAFMVLSLDPPKLSAISGLVRYLDEFATVTGA